MLAYRRLDTREERAFCRLWSASRAFYLLYRIGIVAVGHVSACTTHWVLEASTAPLWQLESSGNWWNSGSSRGFGAVRRPSGPTRARNQQLLTLKDRNRFDLIHPSSPLPFTFSINNFNYVTNLLISTFIDLSVL